MPRVRILVVEDEPKLAQVVASALGTDHYDVVVAPTGEDGFFRANAEVFDLVVLDVMLPGRTGLEILQALRQRRIATPVLILTARDGVVSLSGFVPGYTQKYLAESGAKRVYGVRAVGDELHVELPRAGERPDTVIAEAVLCRLRWDTSVPADSIQITVLRPLVGSTGSRSWNR